MSQEQIIESNPAFVGKQLEVREPFLDVAAKPCGLLQGGADDLVRILTAVDRKPAVHVFPVECLYRQEELDAVAITIVIEVVGAVESDGRVKPLNLAEDPPL